MTKKPNPDALERFFSTAKGSFLFPNEVLLLAHNAKDLLAQRIEVWKHQIAELEKKAVTQGTLSDAAFDLIDEWNSKARRARALLEDVAGDDVFVYENTCVIRRSDYETSRGEVTTFDALGYDILRASEMHQMPTGMWLLSLVYIDHHTNDRNRFPYGNHYTRNEALNASCEWIAYERLPKSQWTNEAMKERLFPGEAQVLEVLKGPSKKSKKTKKNKEHLSSAELPATLPSMPSPSRQMFIKGRDVLDKL